MAFPGITINRLYKKLSTSLQSWNNYDVILLHVGTNDIVNKSEIVIMDDFTRLLKLIMTQNPGCTIVVSSVLPRIVDFDFTIHKIFFINQQLQQLCLQLGIEFLYTFSSFVSNQLYPIRNLYAFRDGGLHLNQNGSKILRLRFCQCISKFLKPSSAAKPLQRNIDCKIFQIKSVISNRQQLDNAQSTLTIDHRNLIHII